MSMKYEKSHKETDAQKTTTSKSKRKFSENDEEPKHKKHRGNGISRRWKHLKQKFNDDVNQEVQEYVKHVQELLSSEKVKRMNEVTDLEHKMDDSKHSFESWMVAYNKSMESLKIENKLLSERINFNYDQQTVLISENNKLKQKINLLETNAKEMAKMLHAQFINNDINSNDGVKIQIKELCFDCAGDPLLNPVILLDQERQTCGHTVNDITASKILETSHLPLCPLCRKQFKTYQKIYGFGDLVKLLVCGHTENQI